MPDYVYENAPLIEVIAEIRWHLTPLASVPQGAIDPHFQTFAEEFKVLAGHEGLPFERSLLPEGMPIELIPGQVVSRFQPGPDRWPLCQIGPGVFTCNVVPEYNGWKGFRGFIEKGVDILMQTYPVPDKYLKITMLELRYVSGFTKKLGVERFVPYLAEELGLSLGFRDNFIEGFSSDVAAMVFSGEVKFPGKSPADSDVIIKVGSGTVKSEPAVLLMNHVRQDGEGRPRSSEEILTWMDDAHRTLHDLFQSMTSERLKELMGPKREIVGNA